MSNPARCADAANQFVPVAGTRFASRAPGPRGGEPLAA